MSKLFNELQRVDEERSKIISPTGEDQKIFNHEERKEIMFKSWVTWVFAAAAVVTVLIAFNYQGGKDAVPLSTIFPDEEVYPVDVEYEFVDQETAAAEKTKTEPVALSQDASVVQKEVVSPVASVQAVQTSDAQVSIGSNDINFTIQIASFKDRKRAEEALAKIRSKVPSAYISESDLGSKGIWYRIYAGQYERRSEAEVSLSTIKRDYSSSFIIAPKKTK